jgi:hypothetical protein
LQLSGIEFGFDQTLSRRQPPAVVLLREGDAPRNADQVLGLQPTQSPRELLNDVSLSTDGRPIDSPLLLSVSR